MRIEDQVRREKYGVSQHNGLKISNDGSQITWIHGRDSQMVKDRLSVSLQCDELLAVPSDPTLAVAGIKLPCLKCRPFFGFVGRR